MKKTSTGERFANWLIGNHFLEQPQAKVSRSANNFALGKQDVLCSIYTKKDVLAENTLRLTARSMTCQGPAKRYLSGCALPTTVFGQNLGTA